MTLEFVRRVYLDDSLSRRRTLRSIACACAQLRSAARLLHLHKRSHLRHLSRSGTTTKLTEARAHRDSLKYLGRSARWHLHVCAPDGAYNCLDANRLRRHTKQMECARPPTKRTKRSTS